MKRWQVFNPYTRYGHISLCRFKFVAHFLAWLWTYDYDEYDEELERLIQSS